MSLSIKYLSSLQVTYRLIKGNQELFDLVSTTKGAEIRKNGKPKCLIFWLIYCENIFHLHKHNLNF